MYIVTDLIALFAAIAVTYLAARWWARVQPRVIDWRTLVGQWQAAPDGTPESITDRNSGYNAAAAAEEAAGPAGCGHGAFELAFEINGITVDPGKLTHIVSKSLLKTIRHSLRKRASAVRCPHHGSAGRIVVTGSSLSDLSWQAPGCCPALQAALRKKLRNAA
jgi:hypothetical protein